MPIGMADFKAVYYGARCLLQNADPYKETEFLRVYRADGGVIPTDPLQSGMFMRAVPVCINLPTTLFLIAPLALLPWSLAHVVWIVLIAAGLFFASYLMWEVAGRSSPGISLLLICLVLANCENIFLVADTAGIVVSLCVIAVWCFLKERFEAAGVVCLALSLIIKPHDAGLVWLYFLLAGGVYRKRAVQAVLVGIVLTVAALAWTTPRAPQWIQELHTNLVTTSSHGAVGDPGPDSFSGRTAGMVIDLQAAISIFRDEPRFYNMVTYVLCGVLLLAWTLKALVSRSSPAMAWLALAAVIPLTLLVTYHRPHDAKLLLLTIPACAMLQSKGGLVSRIAILISAAGVFFSSDILLALLVSTANHFHLTATRVGGKLLVVLLTRPASLVLFAMALFYLWIYVRQDSIKTMQPEFNPEPVAHSAD
jgi:hypothetical protein